jgi:hypothetical protein
MAVKPMISVAVSINGTVLFARSAHRIRDVEAEYRPAEGNKVALVKKAYSVYKVDDGSYIDHDPEEGAIVLAKKLLDTIKEN